MGYIEHKVERAAWGGFWKIWTWLFGAALVIFFLFWPLGLIWSRGRGWYWHALAVAAQVLWLVVILVVPSLWSRGRNRSDIPSPPSQGGGDLVIPARISQSWIEETVPSLSTDQLGNLLGALRSRGWSDGEIAARVIPHCNL
jgi:hypothetical protein